MAMKNVSMKFRPENSTENAPKIKHTTCSDNQVVQKQWWIHTIALPISQPVQLN